MLCSQQKQILQRICFYCELLCFFYDGWLSVHACTMQTDMYTVKLFVYVSVCLL